MRTKICHSVVRDLEKRDLGCTRIINAMKVVVGFERFEGNLSGVVIIV